MTLQTQRRAILTRRIRLLVAATITYNVIEAVVAISAGTAAGSTALIGFGLDSVIEVSSAAAVAWQFTGPDPQARERTTLRVIAVSFFALAAYVGVESTRDLLGRSEPEASIPGIVLAALSLVVMPVLARAKRTVAPVLGSRAAASEANQTSLCALLSAVLLVGLVANAALGWWWADPTAGLGIAALAAVEGVRTWRAESLADTCCD